MKIKAHVSKVKDESSQIKAYADITVENCGKFNNIRVIENSAGELFVSYPQKPVKDENGQPKFHQDGRPMYTDVFYANSKEANDAIKALVLDAYNREDGVAYINPEKGEFVNARIEPELHACHADRTKASGGLEVGGYMKIKDVFVNLATDKDGNQFLAVSYPHYESGNGYKDFFEPLTKGKVWDREAKEEKDFNFKAVIEGVMKKQTLEFHPELAEVLKADKTVDEKIADAKTVASGGTENKGKDSVEKDM